MRSATFAVKLAERVSRTGWTRRPIALLHANIAGPRDGAEIGAFRPDEA